MKTITLGRQFKIPTKSFAFLLGFLLISSYGFAQITPGTTFSSTGNPDFIFSYNLGTGVAMLPAPDGNPLTQTRRDSTRALVPQGTDNYGDWNFASLGLGGSIVVGYLDPNDPTGFGVIPNIPNDTDIVLWETSWVRSGMLACNQYHEEVKVEGTLDGANWYLIGTACIEDADLDFDNATGWPGYAGGARMPGARALRITDITPANSKSRDGYDMDGLEFFRRRTVRPQTLCSPDSVISVSQGLTKGGVAVDAIRSNPINALGLPQDDDTYNFFSLGLTGELVIGWKQSSFGIVDQAGDDFSVSETSFKDPDCGDYPEKAMVSVSADGINWYTLGEACTQQKSFDFSSTGLFYITQIKFTESSVGFGGMKMDYYDVDGVACNQGNQPGGLKYIVNQNNSASNDIRIEEQLVQVFPNPAVSGENVNIFVESFEGNPVEVRVYDMFGAQVLDFKGDSYVDQKISLDGFTPGMYVIKIQMDGIETTEKLIIK